MYALCGGRVNNFNCYIRGPPRVPLQKPVDQQIASATGPECVTVKRLHEIRIARAAAIRLPIRRERLFNFFLRL
jgi:hypothetical protein